jgi:hypothetical protein
MQPFSSLRAEQKPRAAGGAYFASASDKSKGFCVAEKSRAKDNTKLSGGNIQLVSYLHFAQLMFGFPKDSCFAVSECAPVGMTLGGK